MSTSKKSQKSVSSSFVSTTSFAQLIESEKTNNFENFDKKNDSEESEDEELLLLQNFGDDVDYEPQPQPDLLAFLSETKITMTSKTVEKTSHVSKNVQQVKQQVEATSNSVTATNVANGIAAKTVVNGVTSNNVAATTAAITTTTATVNANANATATVNANATATLNAAMEEKVEQKQGIVETSEKRKKIAEESNTLNPLEAKVFAKVCVKELRRSFGSLVDEEESSGGGGSSGGFGNFAKLFRSRSTDHHKSSFSKFDKLQKKQQSLQERNANEFSQKICKACSQPVYLVELIKAEKLSWHKNCFRCLECQKQLSVDTYSSHQGNLYCKPHHRSLFLPKQVATNEETPEVKEKPQLIIRESVPVELPPDVVRASDAVTSGLEDLEIDHIRSKFQLFENINKQEVQEQVAVGVVKRSPSVLAKLAKYEKSTQPVGVLNSELGSIEQGDDSGDESQEQPHPPVKSPLQALQELQQLKQLEQVRNKWKQQESDHGLSREEAMAEERRGEMLKFRSRLCQGKSSNLKNLYEKGLVEGEEKEEGKESPLLELNSLVEKEKAQKLKELFEKGVANAELTAPEKLDMDVFEGGVGKEGRKRWEQLDRENLGEVAFKEKQQPLQPTRFTNALNQSGEIIKGSTGKEATNLDVEIKTEDLRDKFAFFEKKEFEKGQKKVFRMTPPPEGQVKEQVEERPAETPPPDNILAKSKTASKMLSVFRELELQKEKPVARKFKGFTPPRDTVGVAAGIVTSSDEEREESEEEGEQEQGQESEQDAFLKEVGSLARARSLRAKFEKWEQAENERNSKNGGIHFDIDNSGENSGESIESAGILRAKFEEKMKLEKETKTSRPVAAVRRFVENEDEDHFDDQFAMADANCAFCDKKVYAMEKLEANSKVYHKTCFRCSVCKTIMRLDAFTFHHDALYCKNHFKQLFKIKGNYDEGFGFETQKQIFAKKQAEKN